MEGTTLTRSQMIALIGRAQDIPQPVRVTATLFVSRMTDAQVNDMGHRALEVMQCVKTGDKAGFEAGLSSLGLPEQFVAFLSQKAFNHANDKGG